MIISVCSLKGGTGKTSCAVNLGYFLATKKRKKVLIFDMDCQGGTTYSLSSRVDNFTPNIYDLFCGRTTLENATKEYRKNLHFVSASDSFFKSYSNGLETKLEKFLEEAKQKYDFIFFDLSPARFEGSDIPLALSTHCLVPIDTNSTLAVLGAEKMGSVILNVIETKNPNLKMLGVVPNMVSRSKVSKEAIDYLKKNYGDDVLPSIRKNADICSASGMGKTIFEHRSKSKGSLDFEKLGKEIFRRYKDDKEDKEELS